MNKIHAETPAISCGTEVRETTAGSPDPAEVNPGVGDFYLEKMLHIVVGIF